MHIAPLSPDDASGFEAMFALYEAAIEASERKPRAAIAAYLRDPRCRVLVAREGRDIAAFAMLFFPASANFWLLDYMAVDAARRSQGLGAKMFAAASEDAATRGAAPCLIEIDQPGAAVSPGNDPAARAVFYKRLGCRRLANLAYVLPLAVAGTPPPMQVLVHGAPGPFPKSTVRAWLTALYTEVYDRPADDPRIAAMLRDLPEVIDLS
jgi:GNAT superfamily N-acetyltransferase